MSAGKRGRYKFIGCEIIYREACHLAATVPHRVDVQFLPKGLHERQTEEMLAAVQAAVDAVDGGAGYEAVLLGYGRCSNGLVGLRAGPIPLVVPRAHDCITFFLGSREAYRRTFDECPGTYYMTTGWTERSDSARACDDQPLRVREGAMAQGGLAVSYEQLVARHGRDGADFIVRTLGAWTDRYSRMLYLKMGVCDESSCVAAARRLARRRGWAFELRDGDWRLLRKLFLGEWDDDFVVVPPGAGVAARNDERVLDVERADGAGREAGGAAPRPGRPARQ
jgi:hypothetical protein